MQLTTSPAAAQPRSAWQPVSADLAYLRTAIVNLYLYGAPGDRHWVLIDTGMYGSAGRILRAAEDRFGVNTRPAAIILTHGHFDHIGAVRELAGHWDVPVYAHALELPYLTGRSSYSPPDPTVGGGAMAAMAWLYPRGPIDLGGRVRSLPDDGTVPEMPGWQWVHTPGHTPGHVSLYRDSDRCLIAGDAVITVQQESALAVAAQRPEIHGPPMYFTPDWAKARRSVEILAELEPEILATGHGVPLHGPEVRRGLHELARNFDHLAVPTRGRYVNRPAITSPEGVVSVPPPAVSGRTKALAGLAAGALVAAWIAGRERR